MFGFYVRDQFLDMGADTKVSFRLRYPIEVSAENVLPGSYSLPVTIPDSPHNQQILQYPTSIFSGRFVSYDDVVFYAKGIPMHIGTLSVTGTTDRQIKVTLTIANKESVKGVKLSQLDLPSVQRDTKNLMRLHAFETLEDPLDHDYAFVPIYNPEFTTDQNKTLTSPIELVDATITIPGYIWDNQNTFDVSSSTFTSSETMRNITPFLRLDYILSKCAEALGYTIDNQWQIHDELKQIYLYNNNNIAAAKVPKNRVTSTQDHEGIEHGWPISWAYNTQLPDVDITDFLKAVAKSQFLTIIYDEPTKTCRLIPVDDLLAATDRHDWTDIADIGISKEDTGLDIDYIEYPTDLQDSYLQANPNQSSVIADLVASVGDPILTGDGDITLDGFYYLRYIQKYVRQFNVLGSTITSDITFLQRHVVRSGTNGYQLDIVPLMTTLDGGRIVSTISVQGTGRYVNFEYTQFINSLGNAAEDNIWVVNTQANTLSDLRLIMYRGLRTVDGVTYPYASPDTYDPETDEVDHYAHSLLLDGTKGVIAQRALRWLHYKEHSLIIQRDIRLSPRHILTYQHGDKVMIAGQKYFVTEMRPTYTEHGVDMVPCTLNTTV